MWYIYITAVANKKKKNPFTTLMSIHHSDQSTFSDHRTDRITNPKYLVPQLINIFV